MPVPYSTAAAFNKAVAAINTHMNYDTYPNVEQIGIFVKTLGLRSVRDGLHFYPNHDAMNWLYTNLCSLGTDFCYVVDPSENLGPLSRDMMDTFCWLSNRRVAYFEGPNEMDIRGVPDWAQVTHDYQQELASATRPLAQGLQVPLVAPSMAYWQNCPQLGDLTSYCEFGNLHAYPGGNPPENVIEEQLKAAASVSGSKPVFVTECGYSTALDLPGAVSELAQAKYTLRMLVDYFCHGVQKIYLYELLDQEPVGGNDFERHFGVVRSDGTIKPVYEGLKNLLRIVGAKGGALKELDYCLFDSSIANYLLKSGTSWLLFLWRPVSVFDKGKDVNNPRVNVRVQLPQEMPVSIYEPLMQEEPISIFKAKNVDVYVADHPSIVRIG